MECVFYESTLLLEDRLFFQSKILVPLQEFKNNVCFSCILCTLIHRCKVHNIIFAMLLVHIILCVCHVFFLQLVSACLWWRVASNQMFLCAQIWLGCRERYSLPLCCPTLKWFRYLIRYFVRSLVVWENLHVTNHIVTFITCLSVILGIMWANIFYTYYFGAHTSASCTKSASVWAVPCPKGFVDLC